MSLKPGRNSYICGRGGGMRTQASLPAVRRASANARLHPRVSPSASLWPKIRISWLASISSLISSKTSGVFFAVAMTFPPLALEEPTEGLPSDLRRPCGPSALLRPPLLAYASTDACAAMLGQSTGVPAAQPREGPLDRRISRHHPSLGPSPL